MQIYHKYQINKGVDNAIKEARKLIPRNYIEESYEIKKVCPAPAVEGEGINAVIIKLKQLKMNDNYTNSMEFNPKDFPENGIQILIERAINQTDFYKEKGLALFNPLNFRVRRLVDNSELHVIEW